MSVAGSSPAIENATGGAPPRHIDFCTAQLDMLARSWLDVQQTRLALAQRELPKQIVASFAKSEAQLSRALTKTLREHSLWPWLSQFPGLGGAHTALVIGRIGDPRRFPGQRCSDGHYLPPLYVAGAACPIADGGTEIELLRGDGASTSGADDQPSADDAMHVCPGIMLSPRPGTGTRSLWHWAGLHADAEGRAPRKRKGFRCTWEPRVRASVMQPGGIAEQIVRLNVPVYADKYREKKAWLNLRVDGAEAQRAADTTHEIESGGGRSLRPFEADRIARKVAAKTFLADLLQEWKHLSA